MSPIRHLALFTLSVALLGCPSSDYNGSGLSEVDALAGARDDTEGGDRDVRAITDLSRDAEPERDVADVEEQRDHPIYDPDWTEHDNPVVEKCMELIPEICNKLWDCEIPAAEFLAASCPQFADAGQEFIQQGCEVLVEDNASEPAARFMANAAFTILQSCIRDYECTQENLQELIESFTSAGQSGGEGGLAGALPQLLGLIMEECGGSLGFPGFGD